MAKSHISPNVEINTNRKSWNQAIQQHNRAKGNLAQIIKTQSDGVLFPEITGLIPELNKKKVIQLFCNDGRELLSIVKTRAKGIGIDFASNAITFAEELNTTLKYNCTFHCEEVMSWLHAQSGVVADICFTSLGSLWWISDLKDYFSCVYKISSLNAKYILWDFHPFIHILDDALTIKYDYPFPSIRRFHPSGIIDYVTESSDYYLGAHRPVKSQEFVNPFPVRDYIWGVAGIIEAASAAGWKISKMKEYPYILGEKYLSGLVKRGKFRYIIEPGNPLLPLTFSLVLTKK